MVNKTKNVTLWGAGLAVLVGIVAFMAVGGNDNSKPAAYSAGVLTAIENSFDFDTLSMKDGEASHQFELQNSGMEPVMIEKVYTSCMCTTAFITDGSGKQYGEFGMSGHGLSSTKIEINPGESAVVEAVFDPNAHGPSGVGLAERSIYIETNSASSPMLELSFRAMVTR